MVSTPHLLDDSEGDANQRILMFDVSWQAYKAQLSIRGDAARPKIAYLDRVMELVTTSKTHERLKTWLGRLLVTYAIDAGIEIGAYGGWTHKRKRRKAGAEPDDCYIFGPDQDKPHADLVIEVVWKHGGLDKLEIYRRLRIQEVWFWIDGRIEIHALVGGRYIRAGRSTFVPELDPQLLCTFLAHPTLNAAERDFRAAVRAGR